MRFEGEDVICCQVFGIAPLCEEIFDGFWSQKDKGEVADEVIFCIGEIESLHNLSKYATIAAVARKQFIGEENDMPNLSESALRQLIKGGETSTVELKVASPR